MRVALTQTINTYHAMPATVEDLKNITSQLTNIRQVNIQHNLELISIAANYQVDVICLGELFPWPYFPIHKSTVWFQAAEEIESSQTLCSIKEAALNYKLHIIAPIYEFDPSTNKRFNTAVFINDQGKIIGKYRKTHIPEGKNELSGFYEKFYFEPGNGKINNNSNLNVSRSPYFPVFATDKGNIGIMICYDRHFKEVITTLADQGAQVVFCPAASFGDLSKRLWDVDFLSDAIKYRIFLGGNNRCGSEPPWNVQFFGDSHFSGPAGRLEDICDHPNLYITDLDLTLIKGEHSTGWDIIRDRRKNIY